jgi:hypothetical protein
MAEMWAVLDFMRERVRSLSSDQQRAVSVAVLEALAKRLRDEAPGTGEHA